MFSYILKLTKVRLMIAADLGQDRVSFINLNLFGRATTHLLLDRENTELDKIKGNIHENFLLKL